MKNFLRTAAVAALLAAPALAAGDALEKATTAFQKGAYAEVVELASAGGADSADAPRLAYLAGEAQLVLGAPTEAAASFRSVLAARPKAIPAQVGLGRALAALGENDEAAKALDAALKADAKDVGALTARGLLYSATGDTAKAKELLARARTLAPDSPQVVRGSVEVLLRAGEMPEAAAVIEGFSAKRPDHPLGPFLLAWTMEFDGEDEAAIEMYELALERDPTFLDAHKNLAILCHTLSNTYQVKERVLLAFEHYDRYFELGGKDAQLREMYDNLLQFKDQILGG